MTEHEDTQRIEPTEPTRVIGSEPTVAIEPTRVLDSAQPAAAEPAAGPPRRVAPQGSPTVGSPQAAVPQPWYPPNGQPQQLGYPVPGQAPVGYPQPGYPPAGYPQPGFGHPAYPPSGYPQFGATPGYGQPGGYAQAALGQPGFPASGYPQPTGYGPTGYVQPEQSYQGFGPLSAGPYARYANPSGAGSGQPPYNPYAPGYPPPQPWPGSVPVAPAAPKRRTARTILVVALALVLSLTGFGWALRPLLEQATAPVAPVIEPNQPGANPDPVTDPGTDPGTDPVTDPGSNPSPGGTATESVGIVFVEGRTSSGIGAGTGMVLTPDGKVLTNYHVVAGTEELQVTIADTGKTYPATVLGHDQTKDVALLQLQGASDLPTITVDHDEVKVGDLVAALGNAGGNSELVRAPGEVVALDRSLTVNSDSPWGATEDLEGVIETTAGAVPGHSGGPMFDDEGEVLGITTAGSTKAGRSYAVPIADALDVVATIETGQDAGTVRVGPAGYMGIVIGNASRHGVTISQVVADSPADRAGIEVGSTLVKVGDTRVSETTNLASVIRTLDPGDEVTVEWLTPSGKQRSASITLEASPVN